MGIKPYYTPGYCQCGVTSMEVLWQEPVFCNYCGTEILLKAPPRRYRLGYLPLSIPIAHFWYQHYHPQPLQCLTGFSRRSLESILQCERIVANESFLQINVKNNKYFCLEFKPNETIKNLYINSSIRSNTNKKYPVIFKTFNFFD